jgi:hypothetical protein
MSAKLGGVDTGSNDQTMTAAMQNRPTAALAATILGKTRLTTYEPQKVCVTVSFAPTPPLTPTPTPTPTSAMLTTPCSLMPL